MKTEIFEIEKFIASGETFLSVLTADLFKVGVPAHTLEADHLCFRVSSTKEYELYKFNLSRWGELLTETLVNGRPICTFRLRQTFRTENHQVDVVELPAPKLGFDYLTGFEHAEFVVNHCLTTFASKFPDVQFHHVLYKTLNPELTLKVGGRQAKFHQVSLERIIEIEKAPVKDIIFDFDGTLIQSRKTIYEINKIVFSQILGRQVTLQESIENFHPEFTKLFDAFSVESPLDRSRALELWGNVSEKFTFELFDGVVELLTSLRDQGFQLHIWTARDEASTRKILVAHGIENLFSTLSFATVTESKPHPKSLKFDWQLAKPNQVLVLGDSPTDIIGAKNINAIRGAALWDSHADVSALAKAGAELYFHRLAEVQAWLQNYQNKS